MALLGLGRPATLTPETPRRTWPLLAAQLAALLRAAAAVAAAVAPLDRSRAELGAVGSPWLSWLARHWS